MKARVLAGVVAGLALLSGAARAQFSAHHQLGLAALSAAANPEQRFPGEASEVRRHWLATRAQWGPVMLRAQALQSSRHDERGGRARDALVLEELVWEGSAGDWETSLGVKRLDWGVGYGFRPLDVYHRADRLSPLSELEVGTLLAGVSRFGATQSWSLLCGASAEDPYRNRFAERPRCAARAYALLGDWDWQAQWSHHRDTGHGVGLGFSTVVGEATEWHGSVHVDERSPARERSLTRALVGFSYTGANKFGVLLEGWRDEAARAAIGEPRDTLMVRLAYSGDAVQPSLTWLHTPRDRGSLLTLAVDAEGPHDSAWRLGLRQYGGADGAFYSKLPDRRQFFFEASLRF